MVHAISQLPAGKSCMAAGSVCSWSEWTETWGKVTGRKARYRQVSAEEMVAHSGEEDFGREIADMWSYCNWPGYDGESEKEETKMVLYPEDIRKMGVDVGGLCESE